MSDNASGISHMQQMAMLQHSENQGDPAQEETAANLLSHIITNKSSIDDGSILTKVGADQMGGMFNWLESSLSSMSVTGGQGGNIEFGLACLIKEFEKGKSMLSNMIGDPQALANIMNAQEGTSGQDDGGGDDALLRGNEEAFYNMQSQDTGLNHDNYPEHIQQFSHTESLRNRRDDENSLDNERGL